MPLGLTTTELTVKWNETIRQLNCKLVRPQLPPGVDRRAYESDPSGIRVPETGPARIPSSQRLRRYCRSGDRYDRREQQTRC